MRLKVLGLRTVAVALAAARTGGPALLWGFRQVVGGARVPDVPVPPAGRLIDLPGRGTTYVVDVPGPTPDAPTVLLLHGIATTGGLTWFSVMAQLAQRYRVVTFDQRWHGRGIASESFALDDCADDAAAVLDALGVPTAVVVGYSMGGATAQVLWQRHRERVAGLVLCSTAARWRAGPAERAFYLMLAATSRSLRTTAWDRVRGHRAGVPEVPPADLTDLREWCLTELRHTSPWSLPVVLDQLGRFDSTAWIGGVTVPAAVVITARDRAIPTERQRQLAALLPHARVSESPGGHTSLVFDLDRWRPLFLEAVDSVADQVAAKTWG